LGKQRLFKDKQPDNDIGIWLSKCYLDCSSGKQAGTFAIAVVVYSDIPEYVPIQFSVSLWCTSASYADRIVTGSPIGWACAPINWIVSRLLALAITRDYRYV
jgi:hypothetical protein